MTITMKRFTRAVLRAALALLLVALSAGATSAAASPSPHRHVTATPPPKGFAEHRAQVNGITMDYVRGGHGPTLVLLHGYPETWYEFEAVLPALARHFTVIAPDLRGAGASSAPAGGYDKKTMAEDLHQLLTKLGLQHRINLVGHDIGTMVAYSYAAQHPRDVSRLALTEAPIPDQSVYQFPALTPGGPGVWNFGFFNVTNGLPEQMIAGRERTWTDLFIRMFAVHKDAAARPEAVRAYAQAMSDPAHLRGSLEWFRALDRDVSDNAESVRTPLPMPVLAVGADHSLGQSVPDQVRRYATHVQGVVLPDSGHWIFEEHPQKMTDLLLRFLS